MNVFVTVGTTSFDSLIAEICKEECIAKLKKLGYQKILLQIGNGKYEPSIDLENFHLEFYRFKPSISNDIRQADLVISHAGSGTSLEVLNAKKRLLLVINNDLMDNHQIELAQQLSNNRFCFYTTCDGLKETLSSMNFNELKDYIPGNPTLFTSFLNRFVGFED